MAVKRSRNEARHSKRTQTPEAASLMKRINYAWRLFGTGFSFVLFGLGGMVMGLLLFPLMSVFIRKPEARRIASRRLIGGAFAAFIQVMRGLGVLSFEILGARHIHHRRGQLIIANHPTLIDVVFLVSLFPQADCVIKDAVTRNLFMRSTVAAADYISNSAPQDLIEQCIMRLKLGRSLVLFPEGTRSVPDQPLEFKLGAAAVAVGSGAEVLPIVIQCRPPTLAKNEPWYRIPDTKPFFSIQVLPPLSQEDLVPAEHGPRKAKRALNKALLALYSRKLS